MNRIQGVQDSSGQAELLKDLIEYLTLHIIEPYESL